MICRRATACAIERTEKLARSTNEADRTALAEVKASGGDNEKSCMSACATDGVTSADSAKMRRASSCVAQSTCDTFGTCLRDAAGILDSADRDPG